MISNIVEQFRNEMASRGIYYSGTIKTDTNKIERFDLENDKRGNLKGYYTLHTNDTPTGIFGAWDLNGRDYFTWSSKTKIEMSPKEVKKHSSDIKKLKILRDKEKEQRQLAAKVIAQTRFNAAAMVTDHDYLTQKNVLTHGLKFDYGESSKYPSLLVPLYDPCDELQNLQRIFWSEEKGKFLKRYLDGGAIKGNSFLFGEINEASDFILLSEGIATAASIYEACERPTVCAFDCWNLMEIAKSLRKKYPHKNIVVCGDDDVWPDKNGKPKENIGRKDAEDAANSIGGSSIFPDFSTLKMTKQELSKICPTDFNDILSKLKFGGTRESALSEIKRQIESHIDKIKKLPKTKLPHGFFLNDKGLCFNKEDANNNISPIFICSKIEVTAYLRDTNSSNWGRLLEFKDAAGIHHTWGMPMSMLKGSGEELRGELLNRGVHLGQGSFEKYKFLEFITCSEPAVFARCVSRVGWHREGNNRVFVLPNKSFGCTQEKIVYQTESPNDSFKSSGTIDDWRENVAMYCAGNSRLVLAISSAFASMLLEPAGEECGGINFFGNSSAGKTTTLIAAGSVYSDPSYLSRWRATVNGLEALASARNDCLLTLDELAQVDPKEAGNGIYTLANGSGKARANQHGGARPQNGWRILFLSSGEIDLNQHITDGGKKITAGQQVRCVDISADAGAGLGMFENLHGFDSGDAFSIHLKEMSARYYGTACISFLEELTTQGMLSNIIENLNEIRQKFINGLKINSPGGQVKRVAGRLALIAYAGEIATTFGLTGWKEGEAIKAAQTCMKSWIEHRGGTGNNERAALLSQVKSMFEKHGDSRFENFDATGIQPLIRDRLGFKRKISNQAGDVYWYYVLTDGFTELHKGYIKTFAINTLKEAGWLDINEMKEASQSIHIPAFGKKTRCYVLTDAIWDDQKK